MIDPIDSSNNVGKQTYNFNLVQDQLHVTRQCLLVRFREHYEHVTSIDDLLRKLHLVKRAIELKSKQSSKKSPKGGNKTDKANESASATN